MSQTVIVVPCYNEAQRLPAERFLDAVRRDPTLLFLFVDDGSTDGTLALLQRLRLQAPQRLDVLGLPRNRGKAEAVRQGCLAAFARGAALVGYWDADLATPLEAIPEFLRVLQDRPEVELVCGARVPLLGRSIRRQAVRHYLGRVFATMASLTLGWPVYDTQCGAKLFRASPRMTAAFACPFATRWLFDLEILARLIAAGRAASLPPLGEIVYELPLSRWHDVPGSKVRPSDFPKALFELTGVYWRYLRPGARYRGAELAQPAEPAAVRTAKETADPPLAA
jgi:glycosyltransferase involved in cell wall biosynthesis